MGILLSDSFCSYILFFTMEVHSERFSRSSSLKIQDNDKKSRRHGGVIDIPGVITMVLAIV